MKKNKMRKKSFVAEFFKLESFLSLCSIFQFSEYFQKTKRNNREIDFIPQETQQRSPFKKELKVFLRKK